MSTQRPEPPAETEVVLPAPRPAKARLLQDGRDMFWSLAPLVLGVGLLGGFTTFSAFSMETLSMLGSGRFGIAATYILLSLAGAIGGAAIGIWLARVGAVT